MLMLKNVPTYHAFYRKLKDSSSLVKFATALLCVAPLQNMVAESAPTPSVTATETKQLPIPGRPALQQTKQISGKVTDPQWRTDYRSKCNRERNHQRNYHRRQRELQP